MTETIQQHDHESSSDEENLYIPSTASTPNAPNIIGNVADFNEREETTKQHTTFIKTRRMKKE